MKKKSFGYKLYEWWEAYSPLVSWGFFIVVIIALCLFLQFKQDQKIYNNGICQRCGGNYTIDYIYNNRYFYECEDCGFKIVTSFWMD